MNILKSRGNKFDWKKNGGKVLCDKKYSYFLFWQEFFFFCGKKYWKCLLNGKILSFFPICFVCAFTHASTGPHALLNGYIL